MKNYRKPVIGIMGPGYPDDVSLPDRAEKIGKRIAENNWILLTGGRKTGVMDAASKGAAEAGGTVVGILPGSDHSGMSDYVSVPILTGIGSARNMINILTPDVVVVCGMGLGTASEAALALKHGKPVIFTKVSGNDLHFFSKYHHDDIISSDDPEEIINLIRNILDQSYSKRFEI